MECMVNDQCPLLYTCTNGICQHFPITHITIQLILSIFVVPCLVVLSNRVGISTIWILYPVLIMIMSYQFIESLAYISPLALAASFVCSYLCLRQKNQMGAGPAINFYIVNISIPVLVLGVNIGLILSKITPFLYISIIGMVIFIAFLYLTSSFLKDIKANQKINKGLFRSMLPQRIRKPIRSNLNLQMALIQEADSEIQQHQAQLSPSKKTQARIQLIQSVQSGMFPLRQLIVCILCFVGYQCLCLSLPEFMGYLGLKQLSIKLIVSFLIIGTLVILGEIYLYKFYVQPSKLQQQLIKLNLGAQINSIQITKVCGLGFLGGILQGMIGFGFSFCLFFYLLNSLHKLRTTIATVGFLNIFISICFTLSSVFCNQFYWLSYLVLLIVTLLIVSGFQYLFNSYIDKNIQQGVIQSTLITLFIIIIVIGLASIGIDLGLNWVRFGWNYASQSGNLQNC